MTNIELTAEELASVERELRGYVDLDFLEYYLPTIPAGEEFVVGFNGRIIKLTPETVMPFLIGADMIAQGMLKRQQQSAGFRF